MRLGMNSIFGRILVLRVGLPEDGGAFQPPGGIGARLVLRQAGGEAGAALQALRHAEARRGVGDQ
jgi:hypothetical protein